tara:strand:+ start:6614 stop:7015 length:402 start_codon:yes stop_codon:yes gene_type:complete
MIILFLFFLTLYSIGDAKEFKGFGAELSVLDRLSTKHYSYIVPIGQVINIGLEELIVFQCLAFDRRDLREEFALVNISKNNTKDNNSEPKEIFTGWINKSKPSLVIIEHPIFEIKLTRCLESDPIYPSVKNIK